MMGAALAPVQVSADPGLTLSCQPRTAAVADLCGLMQEVIATSLPDRKIARVEAEATRARAASAQRQQLTDLREGMAFLQAQRAARPTTVAVLDELARRLPDSTSLEKAAIEGDRVLLIGLSTEASALVGYLEGSTLWRSPALAGALQNDPRSRADRFTLTAELVPPAADAQEAARAPVR